MDEIRRHWRPRPILHSCHCEKCACPLTSAHVPSPDAANPDDHVAVDVFLALGLLRVCDAEVLPPARWQQLLTRVSLRQQPHLVFIVGVGADPEGTKEKKASIFHVPGNFDCAKVQYYILHSTEEKKITWMWGSPWRSWPTFEASKPWSPSTECERGPRQLVWSQDDWSWGGVQLRLSSTLLKEALC